MDLLTESASALRQYGYAVVVRADERDLQFEDDTLLGHIWDAVTPANIIDTWQARQHDFILRNAARLGRSDLKSWNLYLVFLTQTQANTSQEMALRTIEEDFRYSRKIARAGLLSVDQLHQALYPFIPIQHLVGVGGENAVKRLVNRLTSTIPAAATKLLMNADCSDDTIRAFLEAHDSD
jgi:hypothetical protein